MHNLGTETIATPIATTGSRSSADLLILFHAGARPAGRVVRGVVEACAGATVSHDASAPSESSDEPLWLELLVSGMTFDLGGLAPGPAVTPAALRSRYEVPQDFAPAEAEAVVLRPGPHLRGGQSTSPVLRAQAALAAELVRRLQGVAAVAWTPAQTLIGPTYFVSTVEAWLAGGPFPALGLTAFKRTMGSALQSEGLAFFTGQELHFDPIAFPDSAVATRIGLRLVDELVGQAPVTQRIVVAGPDGEPIVIEPSRNGRFLRVARG